MECRRNTVVVVVVVDMAAEVGMLEEWVEASTLEAASMGVGLDRDRQRPRDRLHRRSGPEVPHHAVGRIDHGSIRHANSPIIRNERVDVNRHFARDFDRDHFFRRRFFPGAFVAVLPVGYEPLYVNNAPYYYSDGLYYQPTAQGSYQEVYPPVGAVVNELPSDAVSIVAGNVTYYYSAGAFYVQQGNQFVVVQPPLGVTVPELPPGAAQVAVNGQMAYQFNGVYYMPVFVNGVTEYQTVAPQ
ncbi:DUF6515 family protein [Pedosphaera parvula]|uniref:Uncharacterized protein n=1 Tax=Pedosphaera parvula (strain Ellin514) TaxID=320771 RepID=B9XSW0_PEDPL|nr:DUF6515 family protein [Pedosphaera parvula]EEF57069.1 hypothetical protein Cflav_PD0104 [Pedosphaera parvula Ellin514]